MKDGKLFGKLNLIDLLVLVVALAAVVGVGLKMSGRLDPAETTVGTSIVYTARLENVNREVYENCKAYIEAAQAAGKPGDQLMASGQLLSGYVTDVTATPRDNEVNIYSSSGAPLVIYTAQADRVDVVFTIQGDVPNNVTTELGTQEVRVGKIHIVKTTHFELTGATILSCEWAGGTGADH